MDTQFLKNKIPPILESSTGSSPTATVLFAGGGGVEVGMIAAGIYPKYAIEMDVDKPNLSKSLAFVHNMNFSAYGCETLLKTVQDVADSEDLSPTTYLHASPVCSNFSKAKGHTQESEKDINAAIAVTKIIRAQKPEIFTLENVPAYKHSKSYFSIISALARLNYHVRSKVFDLSRFGLPQSRKRLILVAGRDRYFTYPEEQQLTSWFSAIYDLIPELPSSALLPKQQAAVEKYYQDQNKISPLLLLRVGGRGFRRARNVNDFAPTLTRSMFTCGNGGNRNKVFDIHFPEGVIKCLTIRAIARIQGFPDWYQFSGEAGVDGSIIGYSVPPLFSRQLFVHLENQRRR